MTPAEVHQRFITAILDLSDPSISNQLAGEAEAVIASGFLSDGSESPQLLSAYAAVDVAYDAAAAAKPDPAPAGSSSAAGTFNSTLCGRVGGVYCSGPMPQHSGGSVPGWLKGSALAAGALLLTAADIAQGGLDPVTDGADAADIDALVDLADDSGSGGDGAAADGDGSSCSLNSFAPATAVVMAGGKTEPISAIKVGDRVEAANPATGKLEGTRTVLATMVHYDNNLIDVTIRDAHGHTATLHTTTEHPFWDDTLHAWVDASRLIPGHALETPTGSHAYVESLKLTPGSAYRYNLTIQQLHTYYVLAGTTPVLVHNCPTNSDQADLPIHEQPTRFYAKAGEMLNRIAGNPTTDEQMFGSADAGNGGVSALSNDDLIGFGGPSGDEPITGFREYAPGDDINYPGSILNISDGNNRTAEIANRVLSGEMDSDTLIEIMIGGGE